jgi:2-amino-4-hydroxy-6-hydroxymethyldihydropteridine diphosphokinase
MISGIKRIIFGLGSNLGDRNFYLNEAVKILTERLFLKKVKRSKNFPNPAMLLPNSPPEWNMEFLNIAISAEIDLTKFTPEKILRIAKDIEKEIGREEREKWAPRPIDIDILAIENFSVLIEGLLTIPHPGLFERDFFIKTVTEIEPEILKSLKRV